MREEKKEIGGNGKLLHSRLMRYSFTRKKALEEGALIIQIILLR